MIYTKIKEICKSKNISIRKLERELGFSTGSVCKWDVNQPSFEKVMKVSDYLGVPLEELKTNQNYKEGNNHENNTSCQSTAPYSS